MENNEVEERVDTTNINLAAAYLCEGVDAHLDEDATDYSDSRHVKVFVVGKGLGEVKKKWDTYTLTVNARKFAGYLKDVKAVIHAED